MDPKDLYAFLNAEEIRKMDLLHERLDHPYRTAFSPPLLVATLCDKLDVDEKTLRTLYAECSLNDAEFNRFLVIRTGIRTRDLRQASTFTTNPCLKRLKRLEKLGLIVSAKSFRFGLHWMPCWALNTVLRFFKTCETTTRI